MTQVEQELYRAAILIYVGLVDRRDSAEDRALLRFVAADEAQALMRHIGHMDIHRETSSMVPATDERWKEQSLMEAIKECGHNSSALARKLGISRGTVVRWRRLYDPDYKPRRKGRAALAG